MSKILFAIAIFTSLSIAAYAQLSGRPATLPSVCYPADELFQFLTKNKERPVFLGEDNVYETEVPKSINAILFMNEKTGDYTIVLVSKATGLACISSSGHGKLMAGVPI